MISMRSVKISGAKRKNGATRPSLIHRGGSNPVLRIEALAQEGFVRQTDEILGVQSRMDEQER